MRPQMAQHAIARGIFDQRLFAVASNHCTRLAVFSSLRAVLGALRLYPARLLIGKARLCHRDSVCHLMSCRLQVRGVWKTKGDLAWR